MCASVRVYKIWNFLHVTSIFLCMCVCSYALFLLKYTYPDTYTVITIFICKHLVRRHQSQMTVTAEFMTSNVSINNHPIFHPSYARTTTRTHKRFYTYMQTCVCAPLLPVMYCNIIICMRLVSSLLIRAHT